MASAAAAAAAASVAVIVVVFGSRVKHRTDSLHGFEQLKHHRSLTLYEVENKRKNKESFWGFYVLETKLN